MIEDDRYCIDIVTQLSAVRAALRRAEEAILADHVAHCVEQAITSGNKALQRRKLAGLTGEPEVRIKRRRNRPAVAAEMASGSAVAGVDGKTNCLKTINLPMA